MTPRTVLTVYTLALGALCNLPSASERPAEFAHQWNDHLCSTLKEGSWDHSYTNQWTTFPACQQSFLTNYVHRNLRHASIDESQSRSSKTVKDNHRNERPPKGFSGLFQDMIQSTPAVWSITRAPMERFVGEARTCSRFGLHRPSLHARLDLCRLCTRRMHQWHRPQDPSEGLS